MFLHTHNPESFTPGDIMAIVSSVMEQPTKVNVILIFS